MILLMAVRKSGGRKKPGAKKVWRKAAGRKRLTPAAQVRGLEAGETAMDPESPELRDTAAEVRVAR